MTSVARQREAAAIPRAPQGGRPFGRPERLPQRVGKESLQNDRRLPDETGLVTNAASGAIDPVSVSEFGFRLWRTAKSLLKRCRDAWRKYRKQVRSVEELARMPERELRDIGLDPYKVYFYTRRRFPFASSSRDVSAAARASIFE